MLNDKLKYYRKKYMLSQEELASQLNVSRQIITKWESGIAIPSLNYLIKLSKLYGVSIDSLVKEDDCHSLNKQSIHFYELRKFLLEAKQNTYASKKGERDSSRKGSHDYFFSKDGYSYLDSFVGSSKFAGEEIVYKEDIVVWSMNYYGRVIGNYFNGDFLKEALMNVSIDTPYRGPECYSRGNYQYYNVIDGEIDCFRGREEIFYQNIKIYECYYHGGIIE